MWFGAGATKKRACLRPRDGTKPRSKPSLPCGSRAASSPPRCGRPQQAAAVLDAVKPEVLHLAALLTGLLDGRLPGVLSPGTVRVLVGAAFLGCRRSGLNPSALAPEEVRRAHPGLPALDAASLLRWALAALSVQP